MELLEGFKKIFKKYKVFFKTVIFIIVACLFLKFLISNPSRALSWMAGLLLIMAFKKSWFLTFLSLFFGNYGEDDFVACAKRLADWLEKLSVAAIIPFLAAALVDESFLVDKPKAIQVAGLVCLVCFFCSIRYTRFIAEGVTFLRDKDDLKEILKFGGTPSVKKSLKTIPDEEMEKLLTYYNSPNTPNEPNPKAAKKYRPARRRPCPRTSRSRVYRRKTPL